MTLIVGGVGQGKLDYALKRTGLGPDAVFQDPVRAKGKAIFNHLEAWVRQVTDRGGDPWDELVPLLEARPDLVLLCDEVGCGVVPMDRADRLWREAVGRLCCRVAERADGVVRLCCGIPTTLKGELSWR